MEENTRRTKNIERLAAALQACFDAAVEEGSLRAERRVNQRMDGFETRVNERMDSFETRVNERMDRFESRVEHRLDRQDETLRMVWKQVKGEGALPVDLHD